MSEVWWKGTDTQKQGATVPSETFSSLICRVGLGCTTEGNKVCDVLSRWQAQSGISVSQEMLL